MPLFEIFRYLHALCVYPTVKNTNRTKPLKKHIFSRFFFLFLFYTNYGKPYSKYATRTRGSGGCVSGSRVRRTRAGFANAPLYGRCCFSTIRVRFSRCAEAARAIRPRRHMTRKKKPIINLSSRARRSLRL